MNTEATYSIGPEYIPNEASWLENPPVDTVVSECMSASKAGIPMTK